MPQIFDRGLLRISISNGRGCLRDLAHFEFLQQRDQCSAIARGRFEDHFAGLFEIAVEGPPHESPSWFGNHKL